MKKVTAILNCSLFVCNVWDKCSSWVDLSITTNVCSSILGLVIKAICSKSYLGSSIYWVEVLSRAFRYCCSFWISPLLYSSSVKLLASVRVSVWPVNFSHGKTSNLVYISIMLEGIMIFSIPLALILVSKFRILLTSLSRSYLIYLSRPVNRPYVGLRF